jgi:hypothetical protein
LPEARGKGLGRQLILAAVDAARERGFERIELDVVASNERARALYAQVGFVEEGVRRRARKFDGQYDDDVIMALLLTPAPRSPVRRRTRVSSETCSDGGYARDHRAPERTFGADASRIVLPAHAPCA